MGKARPKAICIGPENLSAALALVKPDWDFQPPPKTVLDFWHGLNSGEISADLQAVFVVDAHFDRKGENKEFEQVVAYLAPHCFVGILNYVPGVKESIKEQVEVEAYKLGIENNLLYYFIDKDKPKPVIDSSINHYINNHPFNEAIAVLTGKMSEEQQRNIEDERESIMNDNPLGEADEESEYMGQIVSVTSSKGGSGKSTVAISLATYLAYSSESSAKEGLEGRPLKVLIFDLDVRDGQLGFITNNIKPTILNLRTKGISPEIINETVIHSSRLKCDLLLAPKKGRSGDEFPPRFYIELFQNLRKQYDYIILDTSVNYLDVLLEEVAYPTSNQIVFVTDIVATSVLSMARWIREVVMAKDKGGMGINPKKIGIVINKALRDVGMPGERIAKASRGLPIITVVPSSPKLIAHAANLAAMEVILKHDDIRASVRKLAKAIVGNKYQLSDNLNIR